MEPNELPAPNRYDRDPLYAARARMEAGATETWVIQAGALPRILNGPFVDDAGLGRLHGPPHLLCHSSKWTESPKADDHSNAN